MLDNRIYTFLKLCELMNYRLTADELSMTQPAVTQHIQSLEREYDCKLFTYKNRVLSKTSEAVYLERISKSAYYNELSFRKLIKSNEVKDIRLGATKTIGGYVIGDKIASLLNNDRIKLSVSIDNTRKLLEMIDKSLLDFAIVEGKFDKTKYDYRLMKKEEFVGICSNTHPFANKKLSIDSVINEVILLREKGSGTRNIFEQLLSEHSYSIDALNRTCEISSFEMIKRCILNGDCITFAYKTIAESNDKLSTFKIEDYAIYREFNYVYLKNTIASELVDIFCNE